jgi:hypothetical protein
LATALVGIAITFGIARSIYIRNIFLRVLRSEKNRLIKQGHFPPNCEAGQGGAPACQVSQLQGETEIKIGKSTEAINIVLREWQARYLLEALQALEQQWRNTANHTNEDTAACLGNDMMRLTPCMTV